MYKIYNSHPSPTSSDIITMNPMTTPNEDNLPFPLQTTMPLMPIVKNDIRLTLTTSVLLV